MNTTNTEKKNITYTVNIFTHWNANKINSAKRFPPSKSNVTRVHGRVQRVVAIHSGAGEQIGELVGARMVVGGHRVRRRRQPAVRLVGGAIQRIHADVLLPTVAVKQVFGQRENESSSSSTSSICSSLAEEHLQDFSKRSGKSADVRYSCDVSTRSESGGRCGWRSPQTLNTLAGVLLTASSLGWHLQGCAFWVFIVSGEYRNGNVQFRAPNVVHRSNDVRWLRWRFSRTASVCHFFHILCLCLKIGTCNLWAYIWELKLRSAHAHNFDNVDGITES